MSYILHSNNILFVTAIKNATSEGKVPDLTPYHPYSFASDTPVEPGNRIPDAAICTFDKRENALPDQVGKTAAEIRAARGLTV
ncbi:hypothetical protein ACPUER_13530 [Burkholderia sp. DN3021]|uniref:hypothetical protein n=1 Tax=Burkholderia sp. DN3021 TaxID=3410137 RepID=UPI003C7A8D4E